MAEALSRAAFDISQDSKSDEEPSMDEILASIRQIIAEDERSKRVEDDRSLFEVPSHASNRNSDFLGNTFVSESRSEAAPSQPEAAPFVFPKPAPLRAPSSESGSFSASPKLDEDQIARDVAERWLGTHEGELRATVDEVVRPIIRKWMAQNLPQMVERLIREEVENAARRSRRA